jgi:hypothetical protein
MQVLSYEQTEGATRLSAAERVRWVSLGKHVLRRTGRSGWELAVSDYEVKEAVEQETLHGLHPGT